MRELRACPVIREEPKTLEGYAACPRSQNRERAGLGLRHPAACLPVLLLWLCAGGTRTARFYARLLLEDTNLPRRS